MSGCHEGLSPVSAALGRNAASQWDSVWNHSLGQWISGCVRPGLVPAVRVPQRRELLVWVEEMKVFARDYNQEDIGRAADASRLIEKNFPHMYTTPGFSPLHCVNKVVAHASESQYLVGGGRRTRSLLHPWLYSQFEASLGYVRPCCLKQQPSKATTIPQRYLVKSEK